MVLAAGLCAQVQDAGNDAAQIQRRLTSHAQLAPELDDWLRRYIGRAPTPGWCLLFTVGLQLNFKLQLNKSSGV